MDKSPPSSPFSNLLTTYRARFNDDPPLMGVDKPDLARRMEEALRTGRPIRLEDFGVPPDADVSPSLYTWQEGPVDQAQSHLKIYYVPDIEHEGPSFVIAAILPPEQHVFRVELFPATLPVEMDPVSIVEGVKRELDYFLIELREADPWKYAKYHCTSTSNVYSHFQWALAIRERRTHIQDVND
jgi:hypothetical protein